MLKTPYIICRMSAACTAFNTLVLKPRPLVTMMVTRLKPTFTEIIIN